MIFDSINNANLYSLPGGRLSRALKFLKETDFTKLPEGRHEIDGNDIYAIVSDYDTKDADGVYPEAHRIYTDIQYVVTGCELIGFASFNNPEIQKEYDEEKDFALYNAPVSYFKLEAGMFMVLFPGELHKPGIKDGKTERVMKVVIKIREK